MFLLRRPPAAAIQAFLARQQSATLTYSPVGLSQGAAPAGFVVGSDTTLIGEGNETYAAGRAALFAWAPFRLDWVELHPRDARMETGTVVAVLARHVGFWSLNACRVVDVFGTDPGASRCGFAYGTLEDHAETGEETFELTLHASGAVTFTVRAVARGRAPLARLGRPIAERLQQRFRQGAGRALKKAVEGR